MNKPEKNPQVAPSWTPVGLKLGSISWSQLARVRRKLCPSWAQVRSCSAQLRTKDGQVWPQSALVGPNSFGWAKYCRPAPFLSIRFSGCERFSSRSDSNTNWRSKKETKKKQRAPDCFVFVSFLFFPLWRFRNPKSASFLGKKNIKEQKISKNNQKEANCDRVLTKQKQNTNMQSTLPQFVSVLFLFVCCSIFSKEKCRFGIPESHEKNKNKETKKKQKRNKNKALWCNLILSVFFRFVFLCLVILLFFIFYFFLQ